MTVTPRIIDPIERCLACNRLVYESVPDEPAPAEGAPTALPDLDLIVTTCCHVYDRACLTGWLKNHSTCPIDPEANGEITLKGCPDLKDSMVFLCKHYDKNEATANKVLKETADKICSICHNTLSSAYYIPKEKRFMHKACWFRQNISQPVPPEFYPQQIAHFEREIKPTLPKSVIPPTSSRTGLFVISAIWIPVSAWAWGMNWRHYQSKNVSLLLLSLPALLMINSCSLLYGSLKRIFTEKIV